MQDQDDASSSQSQENEASSPAKEMDTAADQDDASSSLNLHRSVIDSLDEVPKFSEEAADLADEDDEASSIHANETTTPFNEPTTTADEDMPKSTAKMGIGQILSTDDAPIPLGATMSDGGDYLDDEQVAKKAACAKPELIHDNLGPDANTSLLHSDSLSSNKKSARSSLETIEDDSTCPLPLQCTDQDYFNMELKVAESKSVDFSDIKCDNESANTETPDESTGDIEHAIHEACPTQQQPDTHPSEASRVSNFGDESIFHPPPEEADTEHEVARATVGRSVHDGHPIDTPLVKAWAVDEGSDSEKSVYMAEEVVETPWWKQRRTKLLLAVLVLFVVLAILGLVISQDVFQSPTISLAPSSSPTECIKRIYSSMQRIDLGGEVDDRYSAIADLVDDDYSIVEVDGSNMVVVAPGLFGDYNGTVIKFFSLTSDGVWERSTLFKVDIDRITRPSASLSGNTAFVNIYSRGIGDQIHVYEKNTIGEWEEVQDPFEFGNGEYPTGWELELDIDGDLACISGGYTHILHRNGSKWIHFDTKDGSACTIFGDTIAIDLTILATEQGTVIQKNMHLFKYNAIQNALSPIQDPIFIQECNNYWIAIVSVLSNSYFAFWDQCDEALYIYRLDPESETYIFHQQLNMEGFFPWEIGMDDDVLVVAGFDETFIFLDQDGTWVKSISIVDKYFQALSDRNALFVSDGEVRAYRILDDCTQPMPTSTPSFEPSSAPSASPTYSSAPSVSLSPSSSSSPTYCTKMVELEQINDPQWPGVSVAVDGSNLVVIVHDGDLDVLQFYSLANTGKWTRLNSYIQFDTIVPNDVALSGNTAFVSFWASPPLVFEQSAAGEWEIVSDPFSIGDNATEEWWVGSVDVDGDLACLSFNTGASLFRRNGSKWTEFHNFPLSSTSSCALSDGTIAVYKYQIQLYEYNESQDAVLPIQDPIILKYFHDDVALSDDYLVYTQDDAVLVYKRNSAKQIYIFHQKLTFSFTDYISSLSLHENTLVVSDANQTHIFVEQNSAWVERTVLDQKYWNVAVSGQNLIASTSTKVHSYNLQDIEDCMAPTPSLKP